VVGLDLWDDGGVVWGMGDFDGFGEEFSSALGWGLFRILGAFGCLDVRAGNLSSGPVVWRRLGLSASTYSYRLQRRRSSNVS